LLGVIIGVLISSCVPFAKPTEEGLRKRVEYLWQQRLQGNWAATYDLLCAKSKKKVSREAFGKGSAPVKQYEILSIEMSPDRRSATVDVSITVEYMGFEFKGIRTRQEWLFESGQWCLKLKPPRPLLAPAKREKRK